MPCLGLHEDSQSEQLDSIQKDILMVRPGLGRHPRKVAATENRVRITS